LDLANLALAHIGRRKTVRALGHRSHHLGTGGAGQVSNLGKSIFKVPEVSLILQLDGNEYGPLRYRLNLYRLLGDGPTLLLD
jgi:hypothetical protein